MYEQLEILYADMPDLRGLRKGYAAYSVEWNLLASAQNQAPTNQLVISDGYAFAWLLTTGAVHDTTNANTITNNPFNLTVTDMSTSQNIFDQLAPAAWNNVVGTAQLPLVLPYPRLLKPQGGLIFALTNLIATAYHVQLTLHGFKLYESGR